MSTYFMALRGADGHRDEAETRQKLFYSSTDSHFRCSEPNQAKAKVALKVPYIEQLGLPTACKRLQIVANFCANFIPKIDRGLSST
jgi:hypothetical protein